MNIALSVFIWLNNSLNIVRNAPKINFNSSAMKEY